MNQARIDIGMRLVIDSDNYAAVGAIMDTVDDAVRKALLSAGITRAAFDFTSFNTQPCKAIQMGNYAVEAEIAPPVEGAYQDGYHRRALPPVTESQVTAD